MEGPLHDIEGRTTAGSSYWFEDMTRRGHPTFNRNNSYVVVRNVKDWGAKGKDLAP
jgi:hypothetical protein